MNMIREEQIREAASAYRINDGEGVRGWEEAAFEAGARWADAHPQWISVEDELPPYEEVVLVTVTNNVDKEVWFDHRSNNPMVSKDENGFCNYTRVKITHWMPCPQPPKERSNE